MINLFVLCFVFIYIYIEWVQEEAQRDVQSVELNVITVLLMYMQGIMIRSSDA